MNAALCVTKRMLKATRGNKKCKCILTGSKEGQEFSDEYEYRCRQKKVSGMPVNSNVRKNFFRDIMQYIVRKIFFQSEDNSDRSN